MYSEKVMDHFRHPHNLREINDADGIGKVGNPVCGDLMWVYIKVDKNKEGKEYIKDIGVKTFGCLPPKEKVVLSKGGWESISSMKVGEQVVNNLGEETTISKTFEIDYNGQIFKIVPFVSPFNSFSVTPEHPILSVKRKWFKTKKEKHSKWLRIIDTSLLHKDPEFVEAKQLKEGDYILFSFNNKVQDNSFFTKEWMRFIGYYLAEGYITANNSVVNLSFHKNEKKSIREVGNLIYILTGKKSSQRTRENVTEIYVCSRKLVRLITSFAGKFARKKGLSEEIMLLPPGKQIEMINTSYIGDGDSTIRREGNSPTLRLATASENLAIQLQEILARNGIFASIVKGKVRKKHFIGEREIKGNDLYIVSFKKERKHKFVHKAGKSFLVPIKKIKKENYRGQVYNLEVDREPKSYLVKGFAVHNCVAAIATSSMITELAKGKTLEEAKKIGRDDVKDALDGLPPIKVHCSNLSADGLHKAIEDYEKKKTAQ